MDAEQTESVPSKFPEMTVEYYKVYGQLSMFLVTTIVFSLIGKKPYWMFCFVSTSWNIVTIVAPWVGASQMVDYSGTLDEVHYTMTRLRGSSFLFFIVMYWQFRDCSDVTVKSSILLSHAIAWALYVVLLGYEFTELPHNNTETWTHKELSGLFLMANSLIGCGGALLNLGRMQTWGGYQETSSRVNFHIRADYFITLIAAIALFAFPHLFLKQKFSIEHTDNLHVYCCRALAVVVLGSAVLFGRASNFLSDQDKATLFLARIISTAMIISCMLYTVFVYGIHKDLFLVDIGAHILLTLNAVAGYKAAEKFKTN